MKKTKSKKSALKLPSMDIDYSSATSVNNYESLAALILDKLGCDIDEDNDKLTIELINKVLRDELLLPTSPVCQFATKPLSLENNKKFRKKRLKPFAQWMKQAVKESGIDQEGVGIVKFLALYCKRWAEMAANDPYHTDLDTSVHVSEYLHKLFTRISDARYYGESEKQVIKKYGKRKMVLTPHKKGGSVISWTYGGKESPEAEAEMDVAARRADMQFTIDLIRAFGLLIQDHRYWWI